MTDSNSHLKSPGMLLIGAAGRNAGKTFFACTLLRRFAGERDIFGIKITPIDKVVRGCPHGRTDCDVCATLKGNFEIAEETDPIPQKDTCKSLAAGAKRVFWLRVLKAHLREGAAALLDKIGPAGICICESNSLRTVVEPGLFLMVKNPGVDDIKPSSEEVAHHVDRLIMFDGSNFDIDLDDFALTENGWTLKMDATAIIMAGGDSHRMGCDKSVLPIGGKPMIQHVYEQLQPWFKEVLISSNDASAHGFLGLPIIPDRQTGHGPLMGIVSAMEVSTHDRNFVIACDIPSVDTSLMLKMLREIAGFDAVAPRLTKSRYEPLFAVYHKNLLPVMNDLLAGGERRIDRVYDLCKMKYIDLAQDKFLDNINTMQDYRELPGNKKDVGVR